MTEKPHIPRGKRNPHVRLSGPLQEGAAEPGARGEDGRTTCELQKPDGARSCSSCGSETFLTSKICGKSDGY